MFKGDDDDDGENAVGATRYPCMPSLVALQQMRNRLHMAQLGKKLMKWTALATGKELRRLSAEIAATYQTFGDDMRNAFILLARCRYFYPNMNQVVLENVPDEAPITVNTYAKALSGVKVIHLEVSDSGEDHYQHLGIDKGGQMIAAAKEKWRNLLKRIILMLDQKNTFQQVDEAHANATKRENVLARIVMPKVHATIFYIMVELEEFAREELYRIKLVIFNKNKMAKKKNLDKPGCSKKIPPEDKLSIVEVPDDEIIENANDNKSIPPVSCEFCTDITDSDLKPMELLELSAHGSLEQFEDLFCSYCDKQLIIDEVVDTKDSDKLGDQTDDKSSPTSCEFCADVVPEVSESKELTCDFCHNEQSVQLPELPESSEQVVVKQTDSLCSCYMRPQQTEETKLTLTPANEVKLKHTTNNKSMSPPLPCECTETMEAPKSEHLSCDICYDKRYKEFGKSSGLPMQVASNPSDVSVCGLCAKTQPVKETVLKPNLKHLVKDSMEIKHTSSLHSKLQKVEYLTPEHIETQAKSDKPQKVRSVDFIELRLPVKESDINIKLEYFRNILNDVVILRKSIIRKGMEKINTTEFLTCCDDIRHKIEDYLEITELKRTLDDRITSKLDHLQCHLHDVMDTNDKLRDESNLSASIENFFHKCQAVYKKLNIFLETKSSKQVSDADKNRLEDLKNHIETVVQLTKQLKKEGLLTPSVERFLISCIEVEKKIESYTKDIRLVDNKKLEILMDHITDLEKIASGIKGDGMQSKSLENVVSSCKDCKGKLENYKTNKGNNVNPEFSLTELISQINDTIELSKYAREENLVSESVAKFIQSCEHIKELVKSKLGNIRPNETNISNVLRNNINDIIKLISQCNVDELNKINNEESLKSCHYTKAKTDSNELSTFKVSDNKGPRVYPQCSNNCICEEKHSLHIEPFRICSKTVKNEFHNTKMPPPPCEFCADKINETKDEDPICGSCGSPKVGEPVGQLDQKGNKSPKISDEFACRFCNKPQPNQKKYNTKSLINHPNHKDKEKRKCDICFNKSPLEVDKKDSITSQKSQMESGLGYFEKNIQKITRIKRTKNNDGSILEEKETIIIKNVKHDPDEDGLDDNEEQEFANYSYETMSRNDKNVGLCTTTEQNQRGFSNVVRLTRSTVNNKPLALFNPILKHSISLDTFRSRSKSDESGCSKDSRYSSQIFFF